ncbi:hypothetical protein GCM10028784_37640 [Myceligenerans cantabricum]
MATLTESAGAAAGILLRIGDYRLRCVEMYQGHLSLHPARRSEGRELAELLGLVTRQDFPGVTPGFTLWTGRWEGIDVSLYADLDERPRQRTVRVWPR